LTRLKEDGRRGRREGLNTAYAGQGHHPRAAASTRLVVRPPVACARRRLRHAQWARRPLVPLVPYLAQGTDIGLHVVLTRGAAGAMRMSMDPFLRRLQETNCPDVVLSCPRPHGARSWGTPNPASSRPGGLCSAPGAAAG
jgi:hypothetical protein